MCLNVFEEEHNMFRIGKYERDYLDYTDINAVIPTHLRTDIVAPALIVQVSDRAVHELIWRPL